MIVDRTGNWHELSAGRNLCLGIQTTQFTVASGSFSEEEFLMIYADGWTELKNGDGEMLGFDRFLKTLRARVQGKTVQNCQQITERIVADLDLFREQFLPSDDRTLLLCCRAEAGAGAV